MNALSLLYTIGAVIIGGIYAWTFTKNGKKWIESL